MKAPNLKKWSLTHQIEGLLYFAQLVNELLFDYTIDTYKIPALNARLLANELLTAIIEYEANALKYGNLEPIIKELRDRLEKDPVVKEILKDYFEDFIKSLKISHQSIFELKTSILFLISKMSDKYFKIVKDILKKEIVEKPERKEKISRLTRIFLIELLALGYSSEYIYFESDRFFFTGSFPKKINNPEIIDTYFQIFSGSKRKYNVIFRVSKNYSLIERFAKRINIDVVDKPPYLKFYNKSENVKDYLSNNEKYPLFIIVKDLESLDTFKSREQADEKINIIDSLAKYHVHRTNFLHLDSALVYSTDQKTFGIVKKPKPSILKRPDRLSDRLSDLIDETVAAIVSDKLDQESFIRLFRAFKQHYAGLTATTRESQLLGLWSAIEVIFPPKLQGDDRIKQISDSILPFICSEYAAKLSANLYSSLKNSGEDKALDLLNNVHEGDNPIEKCLAMLSNKTNESIREDIRNLYTWNPNLRSRIFYLSKKFSNGGEFLKTVKSHNERVAWQVRRIYRTRNLIIHTGKTVEYLNILLENLHSYLDRVLDILVEKIIRCPRKTSIDQCAFEVRLEMEAHLRKLESFKKIECEPSNYKIILFGKQ